jgi:hypothetical protein
MATILKLEGVLLKRNYLSDMCTAGSEQLLMYLFPSA